MALTVNSNIASLNAQRNLNGSSSALSTSLERLSSGSKINSAKDDAAGLQISNRLTSQINGLSVAVKNANDGISIAQTAEGAMQESTNIMQRMRDLALQAANGSNSDSERSALQSEFSALSGELTRIAETTSFGGKKLLDGSMGSTSFQIGSNANETVSFGLSSVGASSLKGSYSSAKATGDLNALSASVTGAANKFTSAGMGAEANIRFGAEFEITMGGFTGDALTAGGSVALGAGTVTLTAGQTLDEVVDTFNAASGTTGVSAANKDGNLVLSSDNDFTITASAYTAALNLTVDNTTARAVGAAFDKPVLGQAGDLVLNVGGSTTTITLAATDRLEGSLDGVDGIIEKINAQTVNTGVTASVDEATGGLKLTGTSDFTIDASSDDPVVLALGMVESGNPSKEISSVVGTNLRDATLAADNDLTIGGVSIGLTLGDTAQTAVDRINSYTDYTGVTATVEEDGIKLSSSTAFDLGGTAGQLAAVGLTAGQVAPASTGSDGVAKNGTISINGTSVDFTQGQSIDDVMGAINAVTDSTGVTASQKDGRLLLSSADGKEIKLADGAGAAGSLSALGLTSGTTSAKLQSDTSINLNGTEIKLAKGSDMDAIVTAINTASTGVTATKTDTGTLELFSGNESFEVADGADGTGLAALGLTSAAGTHTGVVVESSISNLDITSAEGAQQAISVLDGAMQQIDGERAKLGAVQNRFESSISNLQNISENASAARSRVMDTDYAAESANLAKNQILQQAGTAMLAQANQLPQAVLSLLG
ncbi:flagellin [Halopseudomonas aestusnigri]|uniref:flagellin N-terminal helical domain-containing protein n=1 Tax=Halopseudomonas aestusnigri TaxID=857252 RepID=UPI001E2E1343|nr:flagellin hook IN motif-containing protein [Halopseudomonas aestusnigri]UGV29534.1 flagellin [Halopseudomonas aestusnigri]